MIVPIPEEGVGQGWEDLGDGHMAARMYRFLQRDVDEGRIFYLHDEGSIGHSDYFTFQVS